MLCYMLCHRIGEDDRILIIQEKWLRKIHAKIKTYEIRPVACRNLIGKRVFLCQSATSQVYSSAIVADVVGPLSEDEWAALRPGHLVDGGRMYDRTYAWKLVDVRRLQHPIQIKRPRGSVGIQIGPGSG
jgi:hypothetical protein